jgi:hypothetical protein
MRPGGLWTEMPGIRLAVNAFFAPQSRGLNPILAGPGRVLCLTDLRLTKGRGDAAMAGALGRPPTFDDRFECFAPGPNTALFPLRRFAQLKLGVPLLRR